MNIRPIPSSKIKLFDHFTIHVWCFRIQPDCFRRAETLPGLSDHDIVFTEVNINTKKSIQKTRNIPLYSRANWANMKDDLNKLHEDIIKMKDQKSNVNAMWTRFQTKLEKSIDVNVPKKIARKKDGSPWIS